MPYMPTTTTAALAVAGLAGGYATLYATVSLFRWLHRLFFPLCPILRRQPPLRRRLRIAVIGGGVGGTALAHWLRELYGDDLELTIISDGPIGGRCQSVCVEGRRYEGGAAIISELNEYLRSFLKKLRLKEKYFASVNVPLGIYDGRDFLVREADEREAPLGISCLAVAFTIARFAARYGVRSLVRLKGLLRHPAAPNFEKLYRELEAGRVFDTPEEILHTLGPECLALTRQCAASWLCRERPIGGGVGRRMVEELVSTGMRCNYGGQGCEALHAFCGLVSIAGGLASRCFAVRGGNAQIPDGLLRLAAPQRQRLHSTARSVRREIARDGSGGWVVEVEEGAAAEAMKGSGSPAPSRPFSSEGPFDLVVIAHPLERSCVAIDGGGELRPPAASGRFRRCVAHFVRGVLRPAYFHRASDAAGDVGAPPPLPGEILTSDGSERTVPFYSIGLQTAVDVEDEAEARTLVRAALRGSEATWKIFAPAPLTSEQLDALFARRVGEPRVLDWFAYPQYELPQKLSPFVLDPPEASLLYLNAIEQAASAMEMSIISARNAANLVARFVDRHRVDQGGTIF